MIFTPPGARLHGGVAYGSGQGMDATDPNEYENQETQWQSGR